jgi:hypothetical protein
VRCALQAVVVLACLSGAAYSQGAPQAGADRAVHHGTALLDKLGICAGQPAARPPEAKAERAPSKRIADPCAGLAS